MRFAERVLKLDRVVPVDEASSERRRNEVLRIPLTLLHNVLALDDLGDMLRDRRIRPCSAEVSDGDVREKEGTNRYRACPSS